MHSYKLYKLCNLIELMENNEFTLDELNTIDDINSMYDELEFINSIEREIEQENINYQFNH